jgi:hypothetical protein
VFGPLLNRRSGLSFRNGVLLYKHLIRLMMDYACPIWRSAARTHVQKLQVLQSKCLRIATNAPWYFSNRQIHEDLGIPFFAVNIIALTEFRLKVSWCGEPLSSATWKAPVPTKGWLKSPTCYWGGLMFSRPVEAVHKNSAMSAQRVVSNYLATLTEVFGAVFLSCKANARV